MYTKAWKENINNIAIAIHLRDNNETLIFSSFSKDTCPIADLKKGLHRFRTIIPPNLLNKGKFYIDVITFHPGSEIIQKIKDIPLNLILTKKSNTVLLERKGLLLKYLNWSYG